MKLARQNYLKPESKIILDENITMLCCYNIFDKYPQIFEEIKGLYLDQLDDIVESWSKIEITRNEEGEILSRTIIRLDSKPIITEGFSFNVGLQCKDINLLRFIKWDIEKRIKERDNLEKLAKGVDIPDFLKSENNNDLKLDVFPPIVKGVKRVKVTRTNGSDNRTVDEIFKDMDKVILEMTSTIEEILRNINKH